MGEQQQTGCEKADRMIERAERYGLTATVETKTDEYSTVVTVVIGHVVPESAKGTRLGQEIEHDTLRVTWYKAVRKGARWKMLTARRWQFTSHKDIALVRDMWSALGGMEDDAERRAAREAEAQRVAAEPVKPQPVGAPEGVKVQRGDMVLVELRKSYTLQTGYKRVEETEYKLMTVRGLTRAGEIRTLSDDRYSDDGGAGYEQKFAGMLYATGVYKLLPASLWDLGRVLELARANTYPNSTTVRCFESLELAKEALYGARLVRDGERVVAQEDIDAGRVVVEEQQQEAVSAAGLPTGAAFEHAVKTARAAAPIMRQVVKPEAWCGHVIVRRPGAGEAYSVYAESAWVEPTEAPVLPWSAPVGEKVAVVALDGTVRPWSAEEDAGAVTVPGAPVVACDGVLRVVSGLVSTEERAAVEAERLVPVGERLAVRLVEGLHDERTVEERAYVVGLVATQLRAGARHSLAGGVLVVRCEGATTVVELAA